MRRLSALLFAVALLFPGFVHAAKSGDKAPDFSLADADGKSHALGSYKGKFVVLEWSNPECPFVKKHYNSGSMQRLQKDFTGKEVVWFSVVSSSKGKQGHMTPGDAKKFLKEKNSGATSLLFDADGEVGHRYDAKTTPHMFVIDPKGKLVYQGAIDDKPSTQEKDLEGAKNYVRAALDEAMAGKPITVATTSAYGCSVKY